MSADDLVADDFVFSGSNTAVTERVRKSFSVTEEMSAKLAQGHYRTPTRWTSLVLLYERTNNRAWVVDARLHGGRALKSGEAGELRHLNLYTYDNPWLKELIAREEPT